MIIIIVRAATQFVSLLAQTLRTSEAAHHIPHHHNTVRHRMPRAIHEKVNVDRALHTIVAILFCHNDDHSTTPTTTAAAAMPMRSISAVATTTLTTTATPSAIGIKNDTESCVMTVTVAAWTTFWIIMMQVLSKLSPELPL